MSREELDGTQVLHWARSCTAELERRRGEIDALNVFPIADADTGTNMLATMRAAVREADAPTARPGPAPGTAADPAAAPEGTDAADPAPPEGSAAVRAVHPVAAALARGATIGARGNSGIILSQVMRGFAEAAEAGPLDGPGLTTALTRAAALVRGGLSTPVEGTILTVLDRAAESARDCPEQRLDQVACAAADGAARALGETPAQLGVLRAAGVVDAGARGLLVLLDCLVDEVCGRTAERPVYTAGQADGDSPHDVAGRPTVDGRPEEPPARPGDEAGEPAADPAGRAAPATDLGARPTPGSPTDGSAQSGGTAQTAGPAQTSVAAGTSVAAQTGGAARSGGVAQTDGAQGGGAAETSGVAQTGTSAQTSGAAQPGGAAQTSGAARSGGVPQTSEAAQTGTPAQPGGAAQASGEARTGVAAGTGGEAQAGVAASRPDYAPVARRAMAELAHADRSGEFGGTEDPHFEVMYLVEGAGAEGADRLRDRLSVLGDSVVVVGDGAGTWSVHVHCRDAGAAIEAGMAVGTVRGIHVESFAVTAPHADHLQTGAEVFAALSEAEAAAEGDGAGGTGSARGNRSSGLRSVLAELRSTLRATGDAAGSTTVLSAAVSAALRGAGGSSPRVPAGVPADRGVLAVAQGSGAARLFEDAGAVVLRGDRGVGSDVLLAAIRRMPHREVLVLPNGALPAQELVAVGMAARARSREVLLLPSASMVQGLAALAVHDRERIAADDVFAMSEAAATMRWGALRAARVRALTMVGTCSPGDGLGLVGQDVVVIDPDVAGAGRILLDRMLGLGGELVTLLLGAEAGEELARELEEHVTAGFPGVEVVVYSGGQQADLVQIGVE
ncbi:DAK2 domain-containing protein [Nocardia thailandica]